MASLKKSGTALFWTDPYLLPSSLVTDEVSLHHHTSVTLFHPAISSLTEFFSQILDALMNTLLPLRDPICLTHGVWSRSRWHRVPSRPSFHSASSCIFNYVPPLGLNLLLRGRKIYVPPVPLQPEDQKDPLQTVRVQRLGLIEWLL